MERRVINFARLLERLQQRAMLPAIWFILSRRECDNQVGG
jgi:superfamily II RNA helicase